MSDLSKILEKARKELLAAAAAVEGGQPIEVLAAVRGKWRRRLVHLLEEARREWGDACVEQREAHEAYLAVADRRERRGDVAQAAVEDAWAKVEDAQRRESAAYRRVNEIKAALMAFDLV